MKRRSSSLMDHSLAFCLLISGDSQYLPFWRIISNTQWLSTSSLLMQYNPDFNYNTSVSNAFFCLLISGDSKYLPFWWIISSKIRNVYQCHHFLVLMQYNHDFDYNPSVWNAFFCLLIYGDSQYCPFWRSISCSNILQWFSISSLFLWNTFKTLIYIPLSETVQNENLFCSCWLYCNGFLFLKFFIQGWIIADEMISLICGNTFYLSSCFEIYKYLLLGGKIVIHSLIKLFAFVAFVSDFERFIKNFRRLLSSCCLGERVVERAWDRFQLASCFLRPPHPRALHHRLCLRYQPALQVFVSK